LILANSGIRVGEARHLRWRDISSTKTLSGQKRLIFTVRGKTGEREVVCNETVERYVERLRKFRTEEANTLSLHEPIFCHPNGRPIGSFKKGFEQVVDQAGVLRGSDGKKRVPYSLRHTYATMRISEGVSVFQLAANMGTSVEIREFLRQEANAGSEDGNRGDEVQGTVITRKKHHVHHSLPPHNDQHTNNNSVREARLIASI
jgi:integrase